MHPYFAVFLQLLKDMKQLGAFLVVEPKWVYQEEAIGTFLDKAETGRELCGDIKEAAGNAVGKDKREVPKDNPEFFVLWAKWWPGDLY